MENEKDANAEKRRIAWALTVMFCAIVIFGVFFYQHRDAVNQQMVVGEVVGSISGELKDLAEPITRINGDYIETQLTGGLLGYWSKYNFKTQEIEIYKVTEVAPAQYMHVTHSKGSCLKLLKSSPNLIALRHACQDGQAAALNLNLQ